MNNKDYKKTIGPTKINSTCVQTTLIWSVGDKREIIFTVKVAKIKLKFRR